MPYKSCSASFCKNNTLYCRKRKIEVLFHNFPPESELNKQWVKFCKPSERWRQSKNSVICSDHFNTEDYQMEISPSAKVHPNLKRLKLSAVPSVVKKYPTPKKPNTKEQLVEEKVDEEPDPLHAPIVEPQSDLDSDATTVSALEVDDYTDLEFINVNDVELDQANKRIIALKLENKQLAEANEQLTGKINRFIILNEKLKAEIKRNKEELVKMRTSQIDTSKIAPIIKSKLSSSLSYNQLDIILNLKKWVRWTMDEVSSALTLRHFSKRAYKYLAIDLNYPLPSLSTLQRHAKTVNLKQGILEDVINMIGRFTRTFTRKGKECVLSFDVLKVSKMMEYDIAADEIVGPLNYMQVVMARSLFQKWKQPVYIGFDRKITKEMIISLIRKLHEKELNVVAIICTNASTNIGCWRELGIQNCARPFFKHPVTNKYVYIIPDSSLLLKQIRNWLLDYGFVYKGNTITADVLYDLVTKGEMAELPPCFTLSKSHFEMTSHDRRNVRKATELLSRTTAIALRQYYPDDSEAKNIADIIEIIALWFRISNPQSSFDELDDNKPYIGIEKQFSALDKMHDFILSMRVVGTSKLQMFQKSVLMQITGVKMLFVNMHEKHQIQALFTRKLNHDVLENFFAQIKQVDEMYDHPSPMKCLHRIRMMLFGKPPPVLHNPSYDDPELEQDNHALSEENFITGTLYSSSDITLESTELEAPANFDDYLNSELSEMISTASCTAADLLERESDAFEFIVGFIANKFSTEFPELDLGTYKLNINSDHDYSHSADLQRHSSDGKIFVPSDKFLKQCNEMEEIFKNTYPNGIFKSTQKTVKKCFRSIESEIPEIPASIIKEFVMLRVHARVRYINKIIANEKTVQAKRKSALLRRAKKFRTSIII
uniref:Uncharacterized protein n=1 Tax=Anopheles albimanus TaxID=7167 RepID=A0A182F698_ANOAL